jgi:hypothetical protein
MTERDDLLKHAKRLRELPKPILGALAAALEKGEYDDLWKLVEEYKKTKKEIKLAFVDKSAETMPGSEDTPGRRLLQKVLLGEKLEFEKGLESTPFKGLLEEKLTNEEIDQLADDYFARGYGYVLGLYHAGALIARVGSLPVNLKSFLQEVRECYAFERYLAVCALCRTVLEISVKDIYNLEGFNDRDSEVHHIAAEYFDTKYGSRDYKTVENYNISLADARNVLCRLPEFKDFKWRIRNLQQVLNKVVHGRETPGPGKAHELVKETLEIVHELYEI